jgi:hypothetical protein
MSSAMMPCAPPRGCAMRHDPASAALVVMLRGLKMYGMAQAVGDLRASERKSLRERLGSLAAAA